MDWAFFIAFDTSFCFLPHKPEKTEGGVTQPEDDLIQMTCFGRRLTCDVAAIDPACVRRDELREQLQGDKLRLIHDWDSVWLGIRRSCHTPGGAELLLQVCTQAQRSVRGEGLISDKLIIIFPVTDILTIISLSVFLII